MRGALDVADLARRIVAGERRALAQGITLVESLRDDDQERARALLDRLMQHTGRAVRIGISGTPGVGKSTFIEALGRRLLDDGRRLAILAIDPSSPTTGGSILGDKTRMEHLAHDDRAFVRPSPSGGALGGIASRTREAMLLCEAAGFDTVFIETVGVGQSEHAVSAITDTFVLLVAPGGGDDLQGQKRGVLELVDVVVVHKADGTRQDEARETAQHYRVAGHLLHGQRAWQPPVVLASSLTGEGIAEVWAAITDHRRFVGDGLVAKRAAQAERWLWSSVESELLRRLHDDDDVKARLPALLAAIRSGSTSPGRAAHELVEAFFSKDR
jgi:LAO/AO transport system kinase